MRLRNCGGFLKKSLNINFEQKKCPNQKIKILPQPSKIIWQCFSYQAVSEAIGLSLSRGIVLYSVIIDADTHNSNTRIQIPSNRITSLNLCLHQGEEGWDDNMCKCCKPEKGKINKSIHDQRANFRITCISAAFVQFRFVAFMKNDQ